MNILLYSAQYRPVVFLELGKRLHPLDSRLPRRLQIKRASRKLRRGVFWRLFGEGSAQAQLAMLALDGCCARLLPSQEKTLLSWLFLHSEPSRFRPIPVKCFFSQLRDLKFEKLVFKKFSPFYYTNAQKILLQNAQESTSSLEINLADNKSIYMECDWHLENSRSTINGGTVQSC